jgi:hypothetical protein
MIQRRGVEDAEFGKKMIQNSSGGGQMKLTIPRHGCSIALLLNLIVSAFFMDHAFAQPDSGASTSIVAAVLPSSCSVQVGTTATAFATIINTEAVTATSCGIELLSSIPANFSYQATDPATNALIGTPNTPVDIAAGGLQTYVFSLTPNAPIAPTEIEFSFYCSNTNPATTIVGVNTLQFTVSETPVPDIIAVAVGTKGYIEGTVVIPYWDPRTGVFAAAATNLGASASITVSGDTGGNAALPMTITICQSDLATGACLAAPTSTVTLTIDTNATPTFNIFVEDNSVPDPSGAGRFDPAVDRIYLWFTDQEGIVRGSTSVAVLVLGAWDY